MLHDKAARGAAFFWLIAIAAIFAAFIVLNPPLRYAAIALGPLGAAAIFVAVCIGFGRVARGDDFATCAALGAGIIGAGSFFIALAHAIRPVSFVVILGCGAIAFIYFALDFVRRSPFAVDRTLGKQPSANGQRRTGWIFLAVITTVILPFVVAPDVSTDGLEYHLLVPKLTIQQNAIRYQPLFVESNYPSLAEYDFIPLLLLGDDRTAKCFHFLCAILLLFAIARLAQNNGAVAAAIFFSMPVAALTAGWAWNDMLFTLFVVLSIVHLVERRFVLAGVLFGFATWTKYTFVLAAIGIAAILIRERARDWFRFAVPVIAIAAIWMTKNALLTGNPVYPFLNQIFHSPFWTAAADHYLRSTLTQYEIPQWHWWTYLAFPFLLTVMPRVIDVQMGILPLALLPLAFVRGNKILKTYVIAVVIGWLLIRTEARSLLSVLAVLSALYAANIERLRGWRIVLGFAVATNLVIMLVSTNIISDPMRYFVGLESRDQYIVRMDPKQAAYHWLDEHAEVHRVLLVGLHDPYYFGKQAMFSSCCDTPIAQTVDMSALKGNDVTHIAIRPREYQRENAEHLYTWSAAQRTAFETFLRNRCRPVARAGDVIIFQLM